MYLGEGIFVNYEEYICKKLDEPTTFLEWLIYKFWPEDVLASKCQDLRYVQVEISVVERSELTPKKKNLVYGKVYA